MYTDYGSGVTDHTALVGREVELVRDIGGCLYWESSKRGYRTTIVRVRSFDNGSGFHQTRVDLADGQSFDGFPSDCWRVV